MLLGRSLSRDVAQFQLQYLHKAVYLTKRSQRNLQLPIVYAPQPRILFRRYAAKATTPTRTVKAAVKRAARQPTKKPVRSTKAKNPAAKKKVTKKKTAKVVKTRKAVAKKKIVPKRKPLTERQKTVVAKKKVNDQIKDLISTALVQPKREASHSAWQLFVRDAIQKSGSKDPASINAIMKDAASKYKSITPAEREHYNHLIVEARSANDTAYDVWVKQHTPLQIRMANNARAHLTRLREKQPALRRAIPKYLPKLNDERTVKRPRSGYLFFTSERLVSGDFKNIAPSEAFKLTAEEWKALTQSEQKKYHDRAVQDRKRYESEHLKVYGVPVGSAVTTQATAAT